MSSPAETEESIHLTADEMAAISRALADPRRFGILQQIAREEVLHCVRLEMRHCISPATISHHLKELQMANLITAEREGRSTKLTLRREIWQAYLRQLGSLL